MGCRYDRQELFCLPRFQLQIYLLSVFVIVAIPLLDRIAAEERRARPPKFSAADTRGVFFDALSDAVRGKRPDLASPRAARQLSPAVPAAKSPPTTSENEAGGRWSKVVSASSLEDEVKRVRLEFDAVVTTPGAFSSGGYRDARLQLSILAMVFGVINEFEGQVRWKREAAVARDLVARTAANCKAGSTQVYNEAKLRQQDLLDLVSGSGLQDRPAEAENDWPMIVDRSPLMAYAELLLDHLQDAGRNEAALRQAGDAVVRQAEMLAVVGSVLYLDGMIDADDDDYVSLSVEMSRAASEVAAAAQRGDAEAVRQGIGAVTQSCAACHEIYR